ncbi:hypothetical protein MJI12_27535, partial [Salmonella enterica subsp. enterica serovar Kentucky]|nr:hypothetical protein [Salmonella enterica subsp. enterica serovar Kentucky]
MNAAIVGQPAYKIAELAGFSVPETTKILIGEVTVVDESEPFAGFAVLSYVYEHEKRDLASRIVSTQHHHHDLSVATLHVHINHD